jgi:hypothetical protein
LGGGLVNDNCSLPRRQLEVSSGRVNVCSGVHRLLRVGAPSVERSLGCVSNPDAVEPKGLGASAHELSVPLAFWARTLSPVNSRIRA